MVAAFGNSARFLPPPSAAASPRPLPLPRPRPARPPRSRLSLAASVTPDPPPWNPRCRIGGPTSLVCCFCPGTGRSSAAFEQAKVATKAALNDGKKLLAIEFPTAGLESVSGDAEGGIEMTSSMMLIRDFCLNFLANEQYARTRIFFPDINEVAAAKAGIFEGTYFKLDYLTKPSGLEDIGFTKKVRVVDHLKPTDEMIVVAYPYFNVNEMLAVEELYTKATAESEVPILVFNGELDRIRSGYYPPFFYPKLAALSKSFLPKFETVFYIHNFKGSRGGTLFRAYPGPWQVLRRVNSGLVCVHEQETMPSLKEVLPSHLIGANKSSQVHNTMLNVAYEENKIEDEGDMSQATQQVLPTIDEETPFHKGSENMLPTIGETQIHEGNTKNSEEKMVVVENQSDVQTSPKPSDDMIIKDTYNMPLRDEEVEGSEKKDEANEEHQGALATMEVQDKVDKGTGKATRNANKAQSIQGRVQGTEGGEKNKGAVEIHNHGSNVPQVDIHVSMAKNVGHLEAYILLREMEIN
ncbi:hypothetical protein L7F22_009972 [Adiantum nelumboides]|nr:hypothetical protein [Adiantum nelumboides]